MVDHAAPALAAAQPRHRRGSRAGPAVPLRGAPWALRRALGFRRGARAPLLCGWRRGGPPWPLAPMARRGVAGEHWGQVVEE
eukprot:3362699-Alexandrium_andersonii.AAC.1